MTKFFWGVGTIFQKCPHIFTQLTLNNSYINHQNGDVGRGDATDTGRLTDGEGAHLRELLNSFKAETLNCALVDIFGNFLFVKARFSVNLCNLTFNITLVFD